MTDLELNVLIAEAQVALHKLLLGKSIVKIVVNGRVSEKKAADVPQLKSYIADLQSQLSTNAGNRAPMGFYY